eukprot:g14943.t2
MDHAALIEDLWAQGGVACENGRPAEERNRLACIAFGTDEFAGDREVACFLASAAAAAAAETAATVVAESLAAATATGSLVGGMAAPKALDRWSLLPPEAAVTLVAVPIHAGNPSCRYNPYHLKIVGREVDGGGERRTVEIMERESDDSQDAFGFREDENLPEEPLPREEDPSGLNDDGDGERGNQELGQADESSTFGVAKGGESVERAWFSLKGVTYVNVHGETHFQPLEEWRLEKERFDTLCRMKFVRSSAVHEVVLQLERIQSIRFLTAVKGATVTYMLDDFFEEQTRNIVECQRELMDIYDRCGQILGRAAKKHLEAEGLLVTNRAWNQMPSTERARMVASQDTGAPTSGDVVSTTGAIGRPSLEEVRLSTVGQEPTRTATAVDGEDIADTVPTSWSFAARQRSECARIARVFRYARHRMRQELRGLALDHAELLLGAVTRTVVTIAAMRASPAASGVPSVPPGETSRGNISQEHPQMEDDVYDLEGVGDDLEDKIPPASEINGQGGTQKTMRRGGRNLRHEARPQATWNKRWAIAVDEDSMGDLSTLALDESMLEGGVDAGLEDKVGVEADTLVEWRKAFRQRVLSTGGKRHQMERSTNRRFDSRISLPENCLSLTRAIQLACELVPHAEETLAVTNPLGAKPVIIEMFEAEITPNLRGVDFFPITHRFHGEQNGMTEDVFVSAMLKLNAVCLGGIDAQLSEVSSDWEESDEEEHGEVTATGDKKDSQHEPTRLCNEKSVGGNLPSVLDARAWDPSVGEALPLTVAAGTEEPQGGLGRREWSRTKSERPSEICGTSAGPCEGISFEVEIGGIFQEWDLQVFPPLQDFVDRARHAQLQVLNALARVPCLLEHPEVKPYQAMAEGYGLGFDLPQGGTDGVLEGGEPSTSWDWGERGTIPETTYKMQEMEEGVDVFLPDCDWLDTLSEDPYYRGLQDKVFLSLASSHNAVYRMVGGLRPLLEEFQALGGFATQREARYERLQYIADPDAIAAKLIASGGREGTGAGSLDLTPVLLAKSTTEWLRDWYSRFERYRQKVRDSSTSCPQVLLSVNVTNLMAYLLALPETSLEEIRLIGPRLMLNSMKTLGAVFRRCNAILSGGLEGVDALGEKAGFLVQIEHWLWQLRDEVKKLHELGSLLKNIGEQGASIDFRTVEHQVREGLESLEFHLAVLQRSVDHAHINMRIASQEFSSLLKKALESLAREIDRLEADILDPAFSSAATDPTKACSRLEAYRHRLLDLQEEESRYRHYNQLVDNDLATTGGKGAAKQQFDEEKMVLDLERVGTKRKQLVLKWAAQRKVCNIRQEWYNSRLISSDVEVMTGQLVQARQAHTFAVTTAGADEVTASCEATLAHLGRVVEAVGFLHNRNLTGAYWERVDQTMPLREDLKASARNESMATLRRAAGLEAIPAATLRAAAIVPSESARQSTAAEGGAVTISSSLAADGAAMAGQDGEKSATSSGNVGKCTVIKGIKNVAKSIDENPPDLEGSGNADLVRTEVAASRRTETVKDQPDVGASNDVSSVATRTLRATPSDGKSRVGKAAAVVSSVAGRGRREEARRRAELYEVFPMAAEWGGVSLAMLLDHGLLERRKKIGSISAEATATAVLRNTLEELRGVWETAPMMFMWRFLEGPPAPGNINQELHVDPDSKHRRRLYSRVLAEPALATRGYSAGGIDGGIGGGGGGGQRGETSHPATEGYTSLLSNGDELLRLAEHCRVVVDNVVDAPPALLAMGNIGKAALEWQKRISWFQELITHWMAVQEQWVRLAPAFVPPDLDVGVPAHQRVRFTDLSGSFHSILGLLRADDLMNGLSGKYQGVEKGGRSLLARVCKLQEDLEVISLAMDRWLSSCTVECPRLLSLPRHQLFRLYRDWAAGRVGSGEAAGETNERVSYMFRGVGEIIWKEIVSTTGGMTVRIHLAAVGVRSSGAGLEVVPFSSPVVAVGRFEIWVKNIDRKLMSAIAHDVETATVAVRQHGKAGGAPGCSTLLLASTTGPVAGGSRKVSTSGQPRSEVLPSSNQPTAAAEAAVLERSQPSLQARLLARSAHWTAAVEEALAGTALRTSPLPPDGGRSSRGGETSDARRKPETMLEEILSSIHLQVNSWTEELCQPGGMTVYNSVSTTALTTQALQQRDVLEELLKTTVPSLSAAAGSAVQSERFLTTSAAADDAPSSLPTESPSAPSSPIVGDEQRPTFGELAAFSPFIWTCHLRHYYTPPVEALNQTGRTHQGNSNNGRGNGQEQEMVHSPPPPLIRVGIGPWNIPYGFEYAGTLERLWLTPLSERCLLHAVHSGKGRYGGLLVSASGNLRRPQGEGVGVPASSLPSPADISTVAQDVAVAFGRPFRMLQSSCVTSPQAVSSVIASTLVAGGVTVFAGVEELPKVSLAVLAESMRAVLLCLHARQEKVLVNGEELLPWGSNNGGGGGGGGPFLGFFATLAKQGPAPQLPLAVRSTFRPVVTALPNTTLLLEAMLLTNGFLGARALVQGVVHGLRKLEDITATDRVHDQGEAVSSGGGSSIAAGTVPTARAVRPVLPPIGVDGNIVSGRIFSKVWASVDAATILQNVAVKAVRIAAEFLGPETARELRAARRKLGLASLTSSERKEKTRHISRAVEARVLIAGFARVLLFEETGGDVRALKSQKTKKTTSSSSGNASPATAAFANGAPTATGDAPKDAGQLEIDARRALIVSTFQQTEILREILKPLEDMAGTGRKLAQQSVKSRATELAESGTATRSQDFAQLKMIVKRALLVSGMSPTTDQIDAASELWQALWSCSRPAVIITGAPGVGKSSILQAMPKMAEHVGLLNRKLNKSLKKLVPQAKKTNQSKVDEHIAVGKGDRKSDSPAKQASASPSDHPGVVFEPPANQRGAAPYRRILNRQVPFLTYVNATGCFRTTSKKSLPDGGTVASESSGSSKGTKATNVSDTSNVSGADSDGGASVFSQRSAASKSSSATGKSGASGGTAAGKSGLSGIPRAAIEGSAFVIPAQEIEVVHTGGCSAEHLIGSTDDKGSWLDGLLLRRLRDLVEGVPVETGDVRHLSPSTITGVAVVHLRADGPALIKGMREAWLKKLSRRKFQHPGAAGGVLRPILVTTVSEFLRQEGFAEGGCCLEDIGDATITDSAENCTPASTCASRMRGMLFLLEGLLDILIDTDENAVVWEPATRSDSKPDKSSKGAATSKPLSKSWAKPSLGIRAAISFGRQVIPRSEPPGGQPAAGDGVDETSVGQSVGAPPSLIATAANDPPDEAAATTTEEQQPLVPSAITRQNELTPAEVQDIEKRLRVTTFLLCVYASIWGMGGHLAGEASRVMCSAYVRQSSPLELRQHIRESNLFDFVVDIRRGKLMPIGDDAGTCPGALPRGMWTLDPHWAIQASELSCPLPPALVIPSPRLSTVATAVYKLLGMDNARVLVEGPSGAGKTVVLSHLLKIMGKGIPDIVAGQCNGSEGSCTTNGGKASSLLEAGSRTDEGHLTEHDRAHDDAISEEEGEKKADAGVDERIRILDRAKRWMADAGAKAAVACSEAKAAMESNATRQVDAEGDTHEHPAEAAGVQGNPTSSDEKAVHEHVLSLSQRGRCTLPRSTVYLSMRRQATTNDIEGVLGRALKREKDGVLEAPQQSTAVIFLDDVHLAQEPRGEGCGDSKCMANSCAAETIRGMIDGYTPLGEIRVSSTAQRIAKEEGRGGGDWEERGAAAVGAGLPRLRQVHPDFAPRVPCGPGANTADPGVELTASRLDYFTLGRLLRPLFLGRTGNISTAAAVQQFFCHEIMREIVEPLRESWQRELATFELARLIRERALDVGVGVEADEERHIIETWLPAGTETPPAWTNARGLLMVVAYGEQQATKAIMASKTAADEPGSKGGIGGSNRSCDASVSYLEIFAKKDDGDMSQENTIHTRSKGKDCTVRTMVAHGVLMNTRDVFSPRAITKHLARAIEMLHVPWPARPDARPLVTPQDATNICKCLRQLSLPSSPLVVVRSEDRGMSREGGPESAFRLACALEGAGVVVMDAGTGLLGTKIESLNGATPPEEESLLSLKAVLRKAVLMCMGKGSRGPYLERAGDAGEDLWLNPGHCLGSKPCVTHHPQVTTLRKPSRLEGAGDLMAGPLVATKTVLLVKGAANIWEGGNGGWALRAIMDLVENGDVRRLFSDGELLKLVAAEEEHERRAMTGTHKPGSQGNVNHTSRDPADGTAGIGRPGSTEEAPSLGESGPGGPGSPTSSKDEILRWSCWTRGGTDFVYRRVVSYIRQSLTVALCLDDDELRPAGVVIADSTALAVLLGPKANLLGACLKQYASVLWPRKGVDLGPLLWTMFCYFLSIYVDWDAAVGRTTKDLNRSARQPSKLVRPGRSRILERAHTLRRALGAANVWGVHKAHREVEKAQLKKRAKDVLDALGDNNQQTKRVQQEKMKVQDFWSEQSKSTREQRQQQYIRTEEVEKALLPIKASYETSRDSLSTLQEEDMEFLCTLCLGAGVLSLAAGTRSNVDEATQQRKQKGLHPELPFIVETVAVMLGNMSGYPQWIGEWVRLKASPSAKIIRTLLLDPAIVDRLRSFDPESEAGRKVAKVVIDKITERVVDASKKNISDGIASSRSLSTEEGGGSGDAGGDGTESPSADTPATQFARQIPLLHLKMESRAGGLLAAWVRDTIILVDALTRAEDTRAEIQADAKATRQEEERIRVENANEVRPLDEELALRVALKSRLSTRQRTIHHRSDLIKELGIMGGAIEDFAATCRQELHDLATAAEFFAGDALCFANVACLAAHLPYTIRTIALNRARNALQKHGVPVSQPCFVGDNGRLDGDEPASTPTKDNGPDNAQWSSNASTATEALKLDRFRLGNFATGVLTNLMQLHRWAYPTDTAIDDDDSGDESDGDRVRGSSVGDGLPFHPAFMDAAMLTLSTPKWPLLLDPEDIALRWLRRVYPGQTRLDAPLPASMVSMEVIAECAGKGEILPVCFAEGGVHSDLAVFLAADVLPIGAGGDERATICQQDGGKRGCNGIDADGGAGSDGFVVIAVDPQSSYTIVLKPGFRLILFESSSFVASFSTCPSTSSSLLFLQNSPEALARIQLVRFGGVDCVGVTASDDGVNCPLSTDGDMESVNVRDDNLGSAQGGDAMSASSSDEGSSSNESKEAQDAPVPAYVLAGMGLISQPGFEMSKTMGARLQEEFARAVPLGSGVDAAEQQQTGEAAASIVVAQRGALAYSRELSAAHEAVIALLAARPPCFNRERPPCAPDMAVPSGGEPTTGVSDEVERDQNRVLNNLIETLFAYKGILEKGLDIVPKCDRASQAKHAIAARKAEKVARTLTSSALRFLAQSSDMMHVSGLDPVFYSPVFPGVRALIQGAIRKAVDVIGSQMQNGWQALESAVVVSLTRSMVTRVADDFKWILPLAALSLTSPGDLPANGWWYTYIALASDRYGKINEASGSTSRLKLAKLFKIVIKANTGADGGLEKEKPKQERSPGDDQEGLETCTDQKAQQIGVVNPGLQQVRNVVGLWLEFDEAEVPTLTEDSGNGQECVNDCSDDDDDTDITRQGVKLSPQQWDLGFDTSDWARDRGATAVAALARDRGIPMKVKADVEKTSTREDDERGSNAFCSTLSQLWLTATTDRGRMDVFQAAEAKAFSSDDVLRRLVLMETTMNSVFARLPGYVLCEARRWVEWIDEVRRSLSAIEEGGNSTAICWLRFLLSHPPPAFESKRTMRKDSSSTSSSSSSSSSDEDTDGGDGSSSSSNGSGGGEDNAKGNPTSDSPDASPSATGVGSQSLAAAGELKPLEALAPHNKVRRDSRERMKIKLGLLDELGMAVDAEEDKNGTSAEAKEEFDAKARNLFRISTSQTRRVASAKKLPSLARETTGNKERSRSDPADKAAKEKMMTPKSSPSANIHEEDDANDEEEDCRFITFVAESFRPQRDNSDWHREVKTDPVPPVTPSDTPSDITHAMADQGLTASPDNIITAVDKPANEPAASRDDTTDTIDTGQQLKSRPTSSPQNLPDGTSDSDSSSEAIQDNFAIETALTGHTLDMPTGEVAKNDGLRSKSKQGAMSRWDDLSNARRAGQFQNTPAARIVAFSTMRSVKTRRRQHQLEVRTEELGCWSQRWNESPLIGIVLLLALAPDEHLAAKSAAACLMAEGGRDNLDGSIPWREVRREAVLGDLHKGCLESALEVSHRRAPVVVMAPANGSFCDPISRHFVSVLSHIERAARKAGTSVTLHDASKPAHVLLGRGVLVAQARRVQKGHARPRGGGNHFTEIDRGGPAMANMTHSAWEVCLKAAADGGWVVFQEFEGAADLISLIIDGIHRRSAVRNASTAAAEGQEKLLREQQVAGKVTSASNTMPQSRDGSIDSPLAPQGTPSNRVTVSAHQVGGPGGTADVPTAARKDCVTRRVAIPGAAGKKRDSASKMSPEHPLFKALSAGEGGAMSTRAQPVATVAQRRPLPEPHKNFRIILLSTASPEIRERDAGRSFGVGESDVVWWRPAPASLFQAAAHTATSKGPARDNSITLALCRDEIVHELGSNATTIDCGELVSAGVESISESCARYMQGGANGRKVIDNGAAINMHLAASLFVLCQADAAVESTVSAETPSRNTFSPPSASSPSDFSQAQERWPKEDAGDGTNPTLPIQHKEMLAYVVDEAVRASVVATELSDAPMVDHVAGVLDAEAAHLRKERIGDIVTPKFK